jgi:nucleoside diphosphate kinase
LYYFYVKKANRMGKKKKMQDISDSLDLLIEQGLQKRERATKLIGSAQKTIAEVKNMGVDTSRANILVSKAQNILKTAEEISDFDEAVSYAENASKLINTLKTQFSSANQKLKAARISVADLEKNGININLLKKNLKEAEVAAKSGSYHASIEKSDKIIKTASVKKQNYTKVVKMIEKAYTKITDAKSIEVDTAEAEQFYNEATVALENDDYKTVISLAKQSIEAADSAKAEQQEEFMQATSVVISELTKDIESAEIQGADVSKPNAVLKQVKIALSNNEIKSTLDHIDLCKNSIEESRTQHQNALDKLNSAIGFVAEADKSGAKILKAEETIAKAEEALKNHDYEAVIAKANTAIDEAEKAGNLQRKLLGLSEQAEDLLRTAKSAITEAKDSGILLPEGEKFLTEAETAMTASEFHKAQKHAQNAIDTCKKVQGTYSDAKDNILKAHSSINNSKKFLDVAAAESKLIESESKMNKGNYEEALELAKSAYEQVERMRKNNRPVISITCPEGQKFKSNTWGKFEVEIINDGMVNADDIELTFSEDIEIRGFKALQSLKAGEKRSMGIGIRTHEIGEIPVSIGITYTNPISKESIEEHSEVWITTERGEMAAAAPAATPAEMAVPAAAKKTEAEGIVKVLSEVEFYQGFIRLKVGIKNEMNTVITDAKLDLEFDETAMRLDYTEPDFERRGNKIIFGVIHPKEKRTVAFYLDPLICTESHIDGTMVYKDIYGELKTTAMKRRMAEVVCPILYTPENINTAMLKRLMSDELTIHDSKIYQIPEGLSYEKAMSVCKDTILAHDLKFIRELVETDEEDPELESWYYGTTKVKKHKCIIKAASRKKTNTIELFVACKDKQVLTGFLAELGHNFNDRLRQLGVVSQPISPVTDAETREAISQTSTLLSHQVPDKTTLAISKRGHEYEVSFKGSEERDDASELCEFIKVSPDSRTDLISQVNDIVTVLNIFSCTRGSFDEISSEKAKAELENIPENTDPDEGRSMVIEDKIKEMASFGKLIYGMFLPFPIQQHLENVKEPLILKTNDNEIPWELLHDETDFMCLKVPIGRRLRSREISRTNPVKSRDRIRALFIANATGDLEGAEEEVDYIIKHLTADIDIEVLKRREATTSSILNAIRSGGYDIIHYAGHAEFNAQAADESALICANKRKIYAQEIKRILGGRPFVFLNACGSGQEKICEDGQSYTGSDTEGLASSFILGGSLAFIGSSWPLPDISAGILAAEFYTNFLKGETVGESLRKARVFLKDERKNDINWMAFILYGDPTIRLARTVA